VAFEAVPRYLCSGCCILKGARFPQGSNSSRVITYKTYLFITGKHPPP